MKFKMAWVSVLSCFLAVGQSHATEREVMPPIDSTNPYDVIIDRNIFRLSSPPGNVVELPQPDLPTIKISGFSESGGMITAFFATVPKDPKETVTYFALSEKTREEGILELVKIYPNQEKVDVLINGVPTTLSVKTYSFVTHMTESPPPVSARPVPNPTQYR